MRPTVHDIAAAAGVSLATVDRVLNQRAGVRSVTRQRVEAVINDIGYVRDMAAANLAKGRLYPLVFILPASDNSFMHSLHAEARQAISRAGSERCSIRIIEVKAFDPAALVAALDSLAGADIAGVALVAVDAPEVRDAVERLVQAKIPVVTLVSDLTGSARHHYAGIDNIAAGRTAARLLGRFLGGRKGEVLVLAGSLLVRDHRERLEGFSAMMEQEFSALTLLPVLEGLDDPETVNGLVTKALADNPDVIGIYSIGAGNRGLIRALRARAAGKALTVVAHELTDYTREALQDGLIDVVLNQDAGHEVRSAVRVLKAKADGLAVIAAQERIRLDIFLKDNLP
ncbi:MULTISPECIES: LacI family DNA-binding transcriptional regulator [Rhizobium]|uniref:LacI family DNA-binding transcriptional regulator n=1 Tax=Rhizobium rhododendri TaxID=2506430 RepID=A0ABY8IFZ8_9HYPH|nr:MULTISPECIES: LacI family DNA-binding transcriptional regulator [Rhizobium]MBZ5759190.1 LacI family DNA-binding transcriptional regulator [Rhizobium sp. VS19-DR96]MBZ5763979.1 LacI family DNA-binding transcriptional regulator [Rhizobium sp. VS19-DR129.2]MBZ5771523.1 LacI family DNA-binding transcriptional regulator [Rhizobium sp. VS19-DRK62.2]MBZ5783790.1 LacI family DNA-binding transcriptional regulator [Rhizobium sp. VS19-DR121]MBZ5801536.1 LacI family DNA-binding transcriptional regulato